MKGRLIVFIRGLILSSLFLQLGFLTRLNAIDIFFSSDDIEYSWGDASVRASGNVEASLKGYEFITEQLEIDLKKGQVTFPENITVSKNNSTISADNISYNYRKYDGSASAINVLMNGRRISGSDILINPLGVEIKDAVITSCDLEHPHLQIKSESVYVYPQFGYIIVWNSFLYLNGIPIFPIPTYVFGAQKYSIFGKKSAIPEIGTSTLEGLYVRENLGYVINESLSGVVSFGTSEKLGLLAGVDQSIVFNSVNSVHLNMAYVHELGIVGGAVYYLDLAKRDAEKDDDLLSNSLELFSSSVNLPLTRVSLAFQYKQAENEYWVDKKPLINLAVNEFVFDAFDISVSSKMNVGLIGQSNQSNEYLEAWRSNVDLFLSKQLYRSDRYSLGMSGKYYGYWYDTGGTWQRSFIGFDLDWKTERTGARLSVSKLVLDEGESFFDYDKFDAQLYDELGVLLFRKFSGHEVGIEFYYVLSREALESSDWQDKMRTLDLYWKMTFHCWKMTFRLNTIRENAFNIGFDVF
ncbi:LPS-assembly protein LptD [bacterium]|nr:LPS-assembly protein LptD [bacterium]